VTAVILKEFCIRSALIERRYRTFAEVSSCQPPLALFRMRFTAARQAVPLSRFTPRAGGGSAFFVDIMPHPKKIVLRCRSGYESRLDSLVEEFIQDSVIFVV
jgi:rhodanese-related sulfurtransferase